MPFLKLRSLHSSTLDIYQFWSSLFNMASIKIQQKNHSTQESTNQSSSEYSVTSHSRVEYSGHIQAVLDALLTLTFGSVQRSTTEAKLSQILSSRLEDYTKTGTSDYIKNFAWEDQRWKRCYIIHIAPRGVNSTILFVYRTGYAYGKEPEGLQRIFLGPFSTVRC